MSNIPEELRYTREHEWARREGDKIVVGITDFAQDQLGDVVYLSLPEVAASVEAGKPLGEVESTKSVSDVYSPVSGTVAEVNLTARDDPAMVNQDPYGGGWMVSIKPSEPSAFDALMTAAEYSEFLKSEAGESH